MDLALADPTYAGRPLIAVGDGGLLAAVGPCLARRDYSVVVVVSSLPRSPFSLEFRNNFHINYSTILVFFNNDTRVD